MSNYSLKSTDFITMTSQFLSIPGLSFKHGALLSKVASMQGDRRVLATNAYFAALLSVGTRTIQRWIRELETKGFLVVRYSEKPDGQVERELFVDLSKLPAVKNNPKAAVSGGGNIAPPHDIMTPPGCHDVIPPRQDGPHSFVVVNKDSNESLSSLAPKKSPKEDFTLSDKLFDAFWSAYPRKEKKEPTRYLFRQLNLDPHRATYITRCVEYLGRTLWKTRDKDKIPLPTTWLSNMGWKDEIAQGWIHEDKRKTAIDQECQEKKQKKIKEESQKEKVKKISNLIETMSEEERLKLMEYSINHIPPGMQKLAKSGKLDGVIKHLMTTYYSEWVNINPSEAYQKVHSVGD